MRPPLKIVLKVCICIVWSSFQSDCFGTKGKYMCLVWFGLVVVIVVVVVVWVMHDRTKRKTVFCALFCHGLQQCVFSFLQTKNTEKRERLLE